MVYSPFCLKVTFLNRCNKFEQILLLHLLSQEVAQPKHFGTVFGYRLFESSVGLESPPHRGVLCDVDFTSLVV